MNNSQFFLAFALPFSMLSLLIFTDSKIEMGERFKNTLLVKIAGWLSVFALIYLNMKGLPEQIEALFGPHASASDLIIAERLAYSIIVIVILFLIWTIL